MVLEGTAAAMLAKVGEFLRQHAKIIRRLQWLVVAVYAFFLLVPLWLPLPDETARVFTHLTLAAQMLFWGLWWPLVLLSMLALGRSWCGLICPEGMLSEWMSGRGLNRSIPRWMRWPGWPFVAFMSTTVYGQLVSVYQYPQAAALVLGGSTLAAMAVGWVYGREKRVWCRHLCPVNGVFQLLAKLAPWHYRVDTQQWQQAPRPAVAVNCAPLVPLRLMKGAADCHMCGRCSGHRQAIALSVRSPEQEILRWSPGDVWQSRLILYGMLGLATGGFLWSASPLWVQLKQQLATLLLEQGWLWPLQDQAPWWLLTHYPEVNDSFSWLDGGLIVLFMVACSAVLGGAAHLALALAGRCWPRLGPQATHRLAQALIPVAGAGVFLGLSGLTVSLLQHEGWALPGLVLLRLAVLLGAWAWSLRLLWRMTRPQHGWGACVLGMWAVSLGLLPWLGCWLHLYQLI